MRPDLPYDWPVAELRRRLAELSTLVHLQQLCDVTGLADLDRMFRLKRGSRR